MADTNMEKNTYGSFERFMYLFLFPVIFTAILTVILLSIFDYNVMNTVLNMANKIPVVEKLVPDPDLSEASPEPSPSDDGNGTAADEDSEDAMSSDVQELQGSLQAALESIDQKDELIAQLQLQLEEISSEAEYEQITEEKYAANIQRLASTYADMMPSRAAAILQNLTMSELVLVLSEMRASDQINILEKMNPRVAAEASIQLKDIESVENLQIAALQERLQVYRDQEQSEPDALTDLDLAQTFAGMDADSAAEILLQMRSTNGTKVVAILRAMEVASRADILAAIAEQDDLAAAQISTQLGI